MEPFPRQRTQGGEEEGEAWVEGYGNDPGFRLMSLRHLWDIQAVGREISGSAIQETDDVQEHQQKDDKWSD